MTSTEERDLNGNIIENNYKKHSLNKAINDNDLYIASKYLLQPIDPAPRTGSTARKLSSEWLSDTESLFSEDEEEEKERLHKLVKERKRNLSNLESALNDIEKENTSDMLEAIDLTLRRLNERTTLISETLESVQKKQNRVQTDFRDNIDVIKEMRVKAQELIKKQDQIGKNYKQVDQYISSIQPVDYTAGSSYKATSFKPTRAKTYDSYSDEDDFEIRPKKTTTERRYSSEEELPSKSKYSDEEDDEPKRYIKEDDDEMDRYSDEEPKQDSYAEDDNEERVIKEKYSDDDYEDEKQPRNEEEHGDEVQSRQNNNDEDEEYLREQEARRAEEKRQEQEFLEDERLREEEQEIKSDDEEFDEEHARRMAEEEIAKLREEEGSKDEE
ncbi:trichohyalin-like [Hydractinia symbiolongicarpus]|uniref:trichohyalin-like n=1 Tax=Hydractinia symbiolongicarpus TaxID=13093 RepID=UPI00254BA7E7|nr:trichohyalin-like [Hydractinia symbiolongicarpus]